MAEYAKNANNQSTQAASMSWDDLMREIATDAHLVVDELETNKIDIDPSNNETIRTFSELTETPDNIQESEFESLIEADDLSDLEQQLSMDQEHLFEVDNDSEQGLETSDIFDEDTSLSSHDMPDPLLQDALDEELANALSKIESSDHLLLNNLDDTQDFEDIYIDELEIDNLYLNDESDLNSTIVDLDGDIEDDCIEKILPQNDSFNTQALTEDLSEVSDILAEDQLTDISPDDIEINLSSFAQPLVEQMAVLSLSLSQITNTKDNSSTLQKAIEAYKNSLQIFWDHVKKYDALNYFCQFIHDNSLILFQLKDEKKQQYHLLERWPGILLNYLMIPKESIDELVDYTADEHWLRPLSLKELDTLSLFLQQLAGISTEPMTANLNHSPTHIDDDYSDISTANPELDEDLIDILDLEDASQDNDDYSIMMSALANEEENNDATDINQNIADTNNKTEDYNKLMASLNLSKDIIEDEEALAKHISENPDTEIMNTLANEHIDNKIDMPTNNSNDVLVADDNDDLLDNDFENTDELAILANNDDNLLSENLENNDDLTALSDDDLLDNDFENTDELAVLADSDDDLLSENLENNDDLAALSNDDLLDDNLENIDELAVLADSDDVLLTDKVVINTKKFVELKQLLTKYDSVLTEQLGQILFAESESDTLLDASSDYSETIQILWDAADTQQLLGIQGIFDFINANVMALCLLDDDLRQQSAECFMSWSQQLSDYLEQGNSALEPLLEQLQNDNWPESLAEDQLNIFKVQLTLQNIINIEQPLLDTIIPLPSLTNILNIHQATLKNQLQQMINIADGEDKLLEVVGEYIEIIQAISDCAIDNQGIENICAFISDNMMNFAMLSQLERQTTHSIFDTLIQQLLDYSLTPNIAIVDLLKHLQDSRWGQIYTDIHTLSEELGLHVNNKDKTDFDTLESIDDDLDILNADLDNLEDQDDIENQALISISDAILTQMEILNQQLSLIINADDDSEALLEAIGEYSETIQIIWDAAEVDSSTGVQQVCDFISENIMALGMINKLERQQHQENFQEWPLLLMSYAQLPSEGIDDLIELLDNKHWSQPLENIDTLRAELSISNPDKVIDTADTWVDPLVEFEEPYVDIEAIDAIDAISVYSPIIETISNISEQLDHQLMILINADDDGETLLEAISNYTELVQQIWDSAEPFNAIGIQTICDFINENSMALGMLNKAQRLQSQGNFSLWSGLVLDYSLAPPDSADLLISQLQDANWPVPMSATQAQDLQQQLQQANTLTTTIIDINLGATTQVMQLNNTLMALAEPLSTALEILVSMDNSNEVFLEAIETYTTHVQAVWDEAEQANLMGIQDVCNFVNDNILMLSAEDTNIRQAVHAQLEQWPMLILDYLTAPAESIVPLIMLLQDQKWAAPLDAVQTQQLREKLEQGANNPDCDDAEINIEAEDQPIEEVEEPADLGIEADDGISLGNAEMLEMLRGEIIDAGEELHTSLEQFVRLEAEDPAFIEATENYTEVVGRLVMASEMVGLPGLQAVCEFININILELAASNLAARKAAYTAIDVWPELVLKYLESPNEHVITLLNHLRESYWSSPLPDERAHELLNSLSSSSLVDDDEYAEPARATQAQPEDVNLHVPEDLNADLWEAFLQEAPQNAAEFSSCLQKIIKNPIPEDVKLAQRIAHTLKGSSNIIGIKGIANLAHHLEDILEYLHDNAVPPPPLLKNTLLEAADTLEIMVDSLQGKEDPPEDALRVLQEVLDWANRIDQGELDVSEEEIAKRKAEIEKATANIPAQAENKAGPAAGATSSGEAEQYLRVPTRTIDNLLRLIGEMSISVGQIQERLQNTVQHTKSLTHNETVMQQRSYDLETLVDIRDISNHGNHRKMSEEEDKKEDDFDSLEFEQYNELHSVTHSFIETIADSRELSSSIHDDLSLLEGMFIQQERLNKEFQQIVMTTRMVPIKTIMSRLERIIRQTCRSTNKQADFEMRGGDILMDGEVLSKLTDPLMHILRNSIDHGMELPDERLSAGKSESGLVVLNCYRLGNNIVVRCEDNGRGLNFTKIQEIAIERGLIKVGQNLSNKELARLIFVSGFSTKAEVTQVSGRGVGMDVVHTSIQDLKGSVDIDSEPGEGTMISLTLPMSLVTEHVLLVNVGKERFALPTTNLAQALTAESGEFRRIGNNINFHMRKNIYPVTTLADLLKLPNAKEVTETETRPLVLVKEEGKTTAVLVDNFEDSRDLVSKNMGDYIGKIRGVAGASILGDGSLITLLDLPALLRSPSKRLSLNTGSSNNSDNVEAVSIPQIMIVDDSLSMRKSLSQLVEDAGFETLLAKDGLEAVEIIASTKPTVMLVDMEMPRMNGIELTTHIRANADTKDIPLFMITSRTTEKHRQLARDAGVTEYLTKPYQEVELLGLINDALK